MTTAAKNIDLGVDLVTFFHPSFWRVKTYAEIIDYAAASPRPFWEEILDSMAAAEVPGLELTFSPFHWEDAVQTFGSVGKFADALSTRGLKLASGFLVDLARHAGDEAATGDRRSAILEQTRRYAGFIRACGGEVMVAGMPMRKTWSAEPPLFVNLRTAEAVADLANEMGAATLREGVRLALHTEAHSVFCTARDVDLFLMLTDPTYVFFCPDTAHLLVAGADPLKVVERHLDRVAIAHWKDAIGPAPLEIVIDEHIHEKHRPYFRRLGAGRMDWPAWIRLMRDARFKGWAILELDAVPDPVAEMRACRSFVETVLAPTYS